MRRLTRLSILLTAVAGGCSSGDYQDNDANHQTEVMVVRGKESTIPIFQEAVPKPRITKKERFVTKGVPDQVSPEISETVVDLWRGTWVGKSGSLMSIDKRSDPTADYPYTVRLEMKTQLALQSGSYNGYAVNNALIIVQGSSNMSFRKDGDDNCLTESAGEKFCR